MRSRLEHYFGFAARGTDWRTEILAGFTTFITMAYIIFVNPAILHETGMPIAAVTAATCLCAAFGSLLMGALANYPLALAPGMGLNAYFTYTVVKAMHVPWQTALGAVFLSGVIFLVLTFTGIRQLLVSAIPHQLHAAVAGGIGLFIAFIGFRNAGIIVPNAATTVALGNLHTPSTALALFGLVLIATMQVLRVRAAMLIGVLGTMAAGLAFGQVHWTPVPYSLASLGETAFRLDVPGALRIGAAEIVFVFLFVDLFDNIGTLVAVSDLLRGCDRYHRRLTDRDQHGDQLHRVLGGRCRGRTDRGNRDRHRASVSGLVVHRSAGGCDSQLRHRSGVDPGGWPDGHGPRTD
jgi:AGZA family xanthine/uracil permease-like MFS transporter